MTLAGLPWVNWILLELERYLGFIVLMVRLTVGFLGAGRVPAVVLKARGAVRRFDRQPVLQLWPQVMPIAQIDD